MRLSTRTRYGVRLMLALAVNYGKGILLLKDIAEKEEISEKYLSQIIIPLRTGGLVNSVRGAKGGYSLAKSPAEITVKEIVEILEGDICLTDCLKDSASCERITECATKRVWEKLSGAISDVLGSITLAGLAEDARRLSGTSYHYQI